METARTRKMTVGAMLFVFVLAAVMCLFVNTPKASAVTSADLQAEASSAAAQLSSWQSQLDAASDAYNEALVEHDAAVQGMSDAQVKIDEAEAKKAKLQNHLSTRAKSMYRTGSTSFIDVLLGASSISDLVTTVDTLNNLNEEDISYVDQAKAAQQEAEAARAEYATQEQTANEKLNEATQVQAEAQATVSEYQAKVSSLDSQVATLVSQEQAASTGASTTAAGVDTSAISAGDSGGGSSSDGGGSSSGDSSSGGSRGGGSYGSVVSAAESRIGCSYVWGASGPDSFDCSGLVMWAYSQIGISLDHSSGSQGFVGPTYPVSQAEPGDILWESGHVGIYAGGGVSIEAMDTAHGVCYGNAYRFDHATHP